MRLGWILILLLLGLFSMSAQEALCPCCTEDHRAFDFWLGQWKVTTPDGNLAGTNTIEKMEDGCVIREQWKNVNGKFTGTSVNYFDSKTKTWNQLWLDNSGSILNLSGKRIANKMILTSEEFTHTNNKPARNKITWTLNEDKSVRQLWEVIQHGEVINVAFDGLYTRSKN